MIAVKISASFKMQNRLHPGQFFKKRAVADAERAAIAASKDKALVMYRKTVTTWNTPTQFTARRTQAGWSIHVSNPIYRFIDKGTSVRHAVMQKGFVPKSKVGVFYAYKGVGGVAKVRKAIRLPGITARGWTEKINLEVGRIIRSTYRDKLHANWINK